MRIICPIDFSDTSVNALRYGFQFCSHFGGGEVHIVYCYNPRKTAAMLIKIDDILEQHGAEDMAKLLNKEMQNVPTNVRVSSHIMKGDTVNLVLSMSKNLNIDMIIIGTTGMTALKDIFIGSTTEAIIRRADIPLMAIAPSYQFTDFTKIALAINGSDQEEKANLELLSTLIAKGAKLIVFHVETESDNDGKSLPQLKEAFKNIEFDYQSVSLKDNIADTINAHVQQMEADLVCLIHHHKSWFHDLLRDSVAKQKLFDLSIPVLIF